MNEERKEILKNFLKSDQERAVKLLSLGAEEALIQINSHGHDFTFDEIAEYGESLKDGATLSDVLDTDELDSVAGGVSFTFTPVSFTKW